MYMCLTDYALFVSVKYVSRKIKLFAKKHIHRCFQFWGVAHQIIRYKTIRCNVKINVIDSILIEYNIDKLIFLFTITRCTEQYAENSAIHPNNVL